MKFKSLIIGIGFVFVLLGSTFLYRQHCLSVGKNAFDRGDFQLAYKKLNVINGWYDEQAGFDLAIMLYAGLGTSEDDVRAFKIADKLAEGGSIRAADLLGTMYANGTGTPPDAEKSFYWFKQAAVGGSIDAEVHIGRLYFIGKGVSRDTDQSVFWYTKAADAGDADAQAALGILYLAGSGVPQDTVKAVKLFTQSALKDNTLAMLQLGKLYMSGDAPLLTMEQATDYIRRAAIADDAEAQYELGRIYASAKSASGQSEPIDLALSYAMLDLSQAGGYEKAKELISKIQQFYPLDLLASAQAMASEWKVGTPLPVSSLDDGALQYLALKTNLDTAVIPNIKIWFTLDWQGGGHTYHSTFIKQAGTQSESSSGVGPGNCHVCAANISVATYEDEKNLEPSVDNISKLVPNFQWNFVKSGAWGDVMQIDSKQSFGSTNRAGQMSYNLGNGNELLLIPEGYSGQGETSGGYQVLVYFTSGPISDRWLTLGVIDTHDDNEGNCGDGYHLCWEWDGKVGVTSQEGRNFTITVNNTGTMPSKDFKSVVPVSSGVYKFNGIKLTKVSGP